MFYYSLKKENFGLAGELPAQSNGQGDEAHQRC